jgi:hypothetical protein
MIYEMFAQLLLRHLGLFRMLANAENANTIRIAPESLFTIRSESLVNLALKSETPPLNANHQIAEPKTTPATNAVAETKSRLELKRPTPANTATNDKIVTGFVIVKKTVEK